MDSPPLDLSRTQAHVDPLLGSTVGAYTITGRAGEGRFGTRYRAEDAAHATYTLQVLRTGLVGDEQEARAANALKCEGIARVHDFAVLPDGRQARVMELLDGRSLDDDLHITGKFTVPETIDVLSKLLKLLQITHTWHVAHGRLGPSSVLRVGGQLKLIDFGLAKGTATTADDLKAVGALGFSLLSGKELEGVPPPPGGDVPERLHAVLSTLLNGRADSAAAMRRELEWLRPATSARKPRRVITAGLVLVALVGVAFWATHTPPIVEPPPDPAPLPVPAPTPDAGAAPVEEPLAPDAGPPPPIDAPPIKEPPRKKQRAEKLPVKPAAPTAAALQKQVRVFEAKLRQQKRLKPDEIEEALHVLNKQRLRLTGDVTEDDRRDIAARLAAWKRVWLR